MSRYLWNYNGLSNSMKIFLTCIDILFLIYFFILWIRFIRKVLKPFYDLFKLRMYSFNFIHYFDFWNIWLILVNVVFWNIVFWFPPIIELPTKSIDDFNTYQLLAIRTTTFSIVISITSITILFRWIMYLAKWYPAFVGLFSTIKIALSDLISLSITLFISMLGFMFTAEIILNCYYLNYQNFIQTISHSIFILNEKEQFNTHSFMIGYKNLFRIYYLVFLFVFGFILFKLFASVIIVRWLYLRSSIYLDNQVKSEIMNRK